MSELQLRGILLANDPIEYTYTDLLDHWHRTRWCEFYAQFTGLKCRNIVELELDGSTTFKCSIGPNVTVRRVQCPPSHATYAPLPAVPASARQD